MEDSSEIQGPHEQLSAIQIFLLSESEVRTETLWLLDLLWAKPPFPTEARPLIHTYYLQLLPMEALNYSDPEERPRLQLLVSQV